MKNKNTKTIVFTALLAAVITVATRFTAIPVFGGMGYVHIGDAFIFLAATLLPTPYAIAAAATGGALADLFSGFAAYILPTAIIKALMALMFFGKKTDTLISGKNVLSAFLAIIILVVGYYFAEVILSGSFVSPLMGMVWNLLQGIFSLAVFLLAAFPLDKAHIRNRLDI